MLLLKTKKLNFLIRLINCLKEEVNEKLRLYKVNYLLGADFTPTIEGNSVHEENIEEFDRFMKEYPDSPTVELIKYFLDNYKDKDINAKIWKKAEN